MQNHYDCLVLGLGCMGSAALYYLARQGVKVLGFDQHETPNTLGSSTGSTRNIRLAYSEGSLYVPLVLRAYKLWKELETVSNTTLLTRTGGLTLGLEGSTAVRESIQSAETYSLDHAVYTSKEVKKKFPALNPPSDYIGVYEPTTSILASRKCIQAFLTRAQIHGAEITMGTQILSWHGGTHGEIVLKTQHESYLADHLVITAGPWASLLVDHDMLPLRPVRVVKHWYTPPRSTIYNVGALPIHFWQFATGEELYSLPQVDARGIKAGFHNLQSHCHPNTIDRDVRSDEIQEMETRLTSIMPGLAGRFQSAEVCMYTMLPDNGFALGKHPTYPQVTIASGFSGHGFKFASAVGEAVADMVQQRAFKCDISAFEPKRFTTKKDLL